jgi:hypothetical protein
MASELHQQKITTPADAIDQVNSRVTRRKLKKCEDP